MNSDFFKRYRFKKIGPLDLNKIIHVFRKINSFLNTHRIKKGFYVYFLFLVVIPFAFCVAFVHRNSTAVLTTHHITLEVNQSFDPTEYIKEDYNEDDLSYIDISNLDMSKTGSYEVYYKRPILEYVLYVDVEDTTAPVLVTQNVVSEAGAKISPEDFVKTCDDATKVTYAYKSSTPLKEAGTYDVTVTATDASNNSTSSVCSLTLREDNESPEITDFGNLTYYVDQKIDYSKQLKITDNYDPSASLKVDDHNVNYDKAGKYDITFTVTDRAGNSQSYNKKIHIKNNVGTVYLTFDDGPSDNTKEIVDILNEYDVHATFFVTCNKSSKRKYIKYAYESGNAIGLHTGNHKYSQLYSSVDAYFKDLTRVSDMVEEVIGKKVMKIRFPGGSSNQISNQYCEGIMDTLIPMVKEKGYTYYDWNLTSGDANSSNVTAREIYYNSVNTSQKNVMILMHDATAKTETVKALPDIIENYSKRGYVFKTIDDGDFVCQHRSE